MIFHQSSSFTSKQEIKGYKSVWSTKGEIDSQYKHLFENKIEYSYKGKYEFYVSLTFQIC